jgi:hypothetical protein
MRTLKPSALSHLLETAQNLPDYARIYPNNSDMMILILEFAQWKPSRRNKQEYREEGKQLY